jgi:hypothetical protein
VALSSVEAEYMAASQASCEALWLRKLLVGLFGVQLRPTVIYCDNQSCIKLSENPVFHDRYKHIEIRYHFIRDYVQRGDVELQYISTEEQVADILTKALGRGKFVFFRDKLGVVSNTFLNKRECSNFNEKVPRQVFLILRCLRGEKVPNVGPSHLICEMQIKR